MFSILISNGLSQDMLAPDKISYRSPTVAGAFYPAKPSELRTMIYNYLNEDISEIIQQDIFAIVVPHAGFVYSGSVAAKAYKQLIGKKYDAIIIIAPSHQKYFKGASVFKGNAYVTPLGNALVDKELSKEITSVNSFVKLSMDGHSWTDSLSEHSLEVQIPFLQIVQPDVPIVPIVMGTQNHETCDKLMKAIVYSVKKLNKKVLIVASSDLSHFHSLKDAKKLINRFLKLLHNMIISN
ncbi:MAG: AmmeMemoRadiSam system protein B, partial [Ignavibacteria bacterium]|nr:AmmeMemoRadiSam system protein B [Ignavibacteria bacterium]